MRARLIVPCFVASSLLPLAGCDPCVGTTCGFTETQRNFAQTLSPLPEPEPDPTNRFAQDEGAATLGQKLFFETRYSGALKVASTLGAVGETGKVGCISCHAGVDTFADTRSAPGNVSLGVSYTTRNAPALVNVVYYKWHGWAGKQDSLWQQASLSPETGTNTAGDRCGYSHMLWNFYRDEYNAIFTDTPLPEALDPASAEAARFPAKCKPKASATAADGPWELMTEDDRFAILQVMANQGKAVAAYETRLISRNAPFDRFMAGDNTAISETAVLGFQLFLGKAGCANCHNGPMFSDQKFHNLGVPQTGVNAPASDPGHFEDVAELLKHPCNSASPYSDDPTIGWLDGLAPTDTDKGAFRTPSLRNVSKTAPYMHDGAFATLREVVNFYNQGGGLNTALYTGAKHIRMEPLSLSNDEIEMLIEFLGTLNGEPIPAALVENPLRAM
jgi:cytochrome c peroxidase